MRLLSGVFLIAAILTAVPADAGQTSSTPPTVVRDIVVLEGGNIQLGDLFHNVGARGAVIVAQAPAPGRRVVFDSLSLANIAHAHGLSWQPASRFDRVEVRRASQRIALEDVKRAIGDALQAHGVDDQFEIDLDRRKAELHLPTGVAPTLNIDDLTFDDRAKRFKATVLAPAEGPDQQKFRISGRVFSIAKIPVLRDSILPGQIVSADQVDWISMRVALISRNLITDSRHLVGFTPRRPLEPGQPIRRHDVRPPIIVQKGTLVTMRLHMPMMVLTSLGRALEDGGPGSTIRIQNTQSGMVVHADVINPTTVSVNYRPAAVN